MMFALGAAVLLSAMTRGVRGDCAALATAAKSANLSSESLTAYAECLSAPTGANGTCTGFKGPELANMADIVMLASFDCDSSVFANVLCDQAMQDLVIMGIDIDLKPMMPEGLWPMLWKTMCPMNCENCAGNVTIYPMATPATTTKTTTPTTAATTKAPAAATTTKAATTKAATVSGAASHSWTQLLILSTLGVAGAVAALL